MANRDISQSAIHGTDKPMPEPPTQDPQHDYFKVIRYHRTKGGRMEVEEALGREAAGVLRDRLAAQEVDEEMVYVVEYSRAGRKSWKHGGNFQKRR